MTKPTRRNRPSLIYVKNSASPPRRLARPPHDLSLAPSPALAIGAAAAAVPIRIGHPVSQSSCPAAAPTSTAAGAAPSSATARSRRRRCRCRRPVVAPGAVSWCRAPLHHVPHPPPPPTRRLLPRGRAHQGRGAPPRHPLRGSVEDVFRADNGVACSQCPRRVRCRGEEDEQRASRDARFLWERPMPQAARSPAWMAELKLPAAELRREIVEKIREKWRTEEVIRVKVFDMPTFNMRLFHEILET